MLDINLFREDKGHDPEVIRDSQRRRSKSVKLVDEVIQLDRKWRDGQFELQNLRTDFNKLNKLKTERINKDRSKELKRLMAEKDTEVKEAEKLRDAKLEEIGNILHDSVPISDNEENNPVIRSWGKKRLQQPTLKNHVELVERLKLADFKRGEKVAGSRGYFLKDDGIRLTEALKNFALDFLGKKKYTLLEPEHLMRESMMARCAQLKEFDEELYKVTGEGEDKYLIATSEQPLCAYRADEWIDPSQLPMRCAGFSYCFRTEAGAHGRDTRGLFRTHQFKKVEQFCITSPNENDSWDMLEEMINNSEEFYKALNLPYRVVSVVSGALNGAAAKKYDLEGWFPASQTYRELVSCSNCTDYQSRKLEIRYRAQGKNGDQPQTKQYVHLLNSTLTATTRTMCCILENYQREDGVVVPKALRNYMGGRAFLPFNETSRAIKLPTKILKSMKKFFTMGSLKMKDKKIVKE